MLTRQPRASGHPLVNGGPNLDQSFTWGYHDAGWEDTVRGRTGADGVADFPALSISEATVLVQAPGYGRRKVGWRDQQKVLAVELVPEAILAGEACDAQSGEPLREYHVSLRSVIQPIFQKKSKLREARKAGAAPCLLHCRRLSLPGNCVHSREFPGTNIEDCATNVAPCRTAQESRPRAIRRLRRAVLQRRCIGRVAVK
jgi:hypothetical protein